MRANSERIHPNRTEGVYIFGCEKKWQETKENNRNKKQGFQTYDGLSVTI